MYTCEIQYMNKQIGGLVGNVNASIDSKEKIAEIVDKIDFEQKGELFDELLKKVNSMDIENSLNLCALLINLAESIHDNFRIHQAYFNREMFHLSKINLENSKPYLQNAIGDLKKFIGI